jgi:hypothetical protein
MSRALVVLTLVVFNSVPNSCAIVTSSSDLNIIPHSGGHTSTDNILNTRDVPTVPRAEPSGEASPTQCEKDAIASRPLKTTVTEVLASIGQGGFAKDKRRSEPGSGSVQILDAVMCDIVVQSDVRVVDAREDCDDDQRDARSESTSVGSLAGRKQERELLVAKMEMSA